MAVDPIFNQLSPAAVQLDSLLLDPNNPRLDSSQRTRYTDEAAGDPKVQDEVEEELVDRFQIGRLEANIRTNGFLPIDRIIVREIDGGKYIVLEGNRRICAAKRVQRSPDCPVEICESLERIACLVYSGDNAKAAWLFQGLRHISSFVDWGAFQKAKLLSDQVEEEGLTLTDVGNRFGLTPHGAGQWIRAFKAFCQARDESEYVDHVTDDLYPFMQELFSRTSYPIRTWMGWNETEGRFDEELNFNEFLGWFYPDISSGPDSEPAYDWDSRYIVKRDDIRALAYLYTHDRTRFEEFRTESDVDIDNLVSLSRAEKYAKEQEQSVDRVEELFAQMKLAAKLIGNAPIRIWRDDSLRARFVELRQAIEKAIQDTKE